MSKLHITAIFFTLIVIQSMAQNFYIKVQGGYSLAAFSQTKYNQRRSGYILINSEAVKYSYGKGINYTGTLGVMFTKNIGAELGIGYLYGSKVETKISSYGPNGESKWFITEQNKMLFFVPALIIESGFEKIKPYARLGIIISKPKIISRNVGSVVTPSAYHVFETIEVKEIKMDWGFGANIAIGISSKLSDKFKLFGECNINALSITPKSSKVTESTSGGVDRMHNMTTSDIETIYENNCTDDLQHPAPSSEPTKKVKTKMAFSSIGANIGLIFSFNKPKHSSTIKLSE